MSIIDFVLDVLGLPFLYPAQCLLLKLLCLENEHLTSWDLHTLDRWREGFTVGVDDLGHACFVGAQGVPPDILDRIQHCRTHGYLWFPDVILVIGRRGSKGLIGAICAARVIWELLLMGDPHARLGIVPGKRLTIPVFAGQGDQARANQFRDIAELMSRAPGFKPFIARRTSSRLLLWTPEQIVNGESVDPERALLEVVAREATPLAARGPATPMVLFDEMGHMVAAGANRSAAEVYDAALPAVAQFERDTLGVTDIPNIAMVFQASSPWDKTGRFYENYCDALRLDDNGRSTQPESFVMQQASWWVSQGWDRTGEPDFLTYPGGRPFPKITHPYLTRESAVLQRAERRDPVMFKVEFGAQWASVQCPALNEQDVRAIFADVQGEPLQPQGAGTLHRVYYGHVDLSRRNANTALVVAHTDEINQERHMVVDLIRTWQPIDHNGELDHAELLDDIYRVVIDFRLSALTCDSYDAPLITQHLARRIYQANLGWRPTLEEVPASAPRNAHELAVFKDAIALGRVHAPRDDLALRELLFLETKPNGKVGPPTTGPFTTSDITDCLFALTTRLLAGHLYIHEALSKARPHFGRPGPGSEHDQQIFAQLSSTSTARQRIAAARSQYANPARGRPESRRRRW